MFRAPAMLLPHESTVTHEQRFVLEPPIAPRASARSSIIGTNIEEIQTQIKHHHPKVSMVGSL